MKLYFGFAIITSTYLKGACIMNQSKLDYSITKVKKIYDEGRLSFDSSIQRASDQWSKEQKSNLIHSLFAQYYIPSLCFYEEARVVNGKNVDFYSVLDGKQRLSVVFEYLNDGFAIKKGTPTFVDDSGTIVDLGGKKFSELDIYLKKQLEATKLNIVTLKELDANERETMFYRLNDGTPLSEIQRSRALLGEELSSFFNALLGKDFFKVCGVSKLQRAKEDLLMCLVQGIMLNDTTYTCKNFNAKSVAKYCEYLKTNFPIELQAQVIDAIDFLGEVFNEENIENNMHAINVKGGKIVFLKRINIPIIINEAMRLCKYKNDTPLVCSFFDDFFDPTSATYKEYTERFCKSATTSIDKVHGRRDYLKNAIDGDATIDLDDKNIIETTTLDDAKNELAKSGGTILSKEFICK